MVNYPGYSYGINTMPTATQPYGYPFMPQAQPQQAQVNTNKIYVSGIEDAKMRMLPPNSEYVFLDNEKSILYQKKVDANGQFEVKAYTISEYKGDLGVQNQSAVDLSGYVPRAEFEALQAELKALNDKIATMTRGVNNGTGTGTSATITTKANTSI